MSEQDQQQSQQQTQQQEQLSQDDNNTLTEQDKKVYSQILGSINRMNKKIKHAKQKVPQVSQTQTQVKRTSVNQIAQKLIESQQNSDVVTKNDIMSEVQSSFEHAVVNVYSQNQQMKTKINSLIAIIKEQNRKINEHKNRQDKLKEQNEKLREELMKFKDQQLLATHQLTNKKPIQQTSNIKNLNNVKAKQNSHENQDYDFWSMPNEAASGKKRKDFVADSGLWVNDKDIDKSIFITDKKSQK